MAMDYKEFVSNPKSMLIAPAGYGKTHTIAECLKHTKGKQLILTHTHAGIASIKEKVKKIGIASRDVSIETISGFAQKYVLAFNKTGIIPDQHSKEYYPFIIKKATELFQLQLVGRIIAASFSGIFVDEYQDCTESQHNLVLALSNILPSRILGDHLQGIFEFGTDSLIDLTEAEKMQGFFRYRYELTEPKRWENHNKELGGALKLIRSDLEAVQPVNLKSYPSIEVIVANENDLFDTRTEYAQKIWALLKEKGESILLIHPESSSIYPRKKIIGAFRNAFYLVEAIDDKDFYKITTKLDGCTPVNLEQTIRDICYEVFNTTPLNIWFNDTGLKRKTKPADVLISEPIKAHIDACKKDLSFVRVAAALKAVKKLPNILCYRSELFYSVLKSLDDAHAGGISVSLAMTNKRNHIRRMGRGVEGKCIGTTLLTKGLEFDTVVILNAHKFKCPKNFYVALTRAKKRLIVFTNSAVLSPYKAE
jgi:hypothetical protein